MLPRRSTLQKPRFVTKEGGKLVGVFFSTGGMTEHGDVCRLNHLQYSAINDLIKNVTSSFELYNAKELSIDTHNIHGGRRYYTLSNIGSIPEWESYFIKSTEELAVYWFGPKFVMLCQEPYKEYLWLLYKAFIQKDVIFGFCPSCFRFDGNNFDFDDGFMFSILSALNPDEISDIETYYRVNKELYEEFDKVNIRRKIDAAGLEYFSLTPRWKNYNLHQLEVWLNPVKQDKFTSGWFSIQDLEQWVDGTGPVLLESDLLIRRLTSLLGQ